MTVWPIGVYQMRNSALSGKKSNVKCISDTNDVKSRGPLLHAERQSKSKAAYGSHNPQQTHIRWRKGVNKLIYSVLCPNFL